MGFSLGIVLAHLIPDKAQAILARAADYAYSREICGDHYHADIEASHALGTTIGIELLNIPKLKTDDRRGEGRIAVGASGGLTARLQPRA